MCKFFSFVTKGSQKYYFDWPTRVKLLKSNPHEFEPDSHSSIANYFKLNDDKVNKFEYNPLTKKFEVDRINIKDNQALAKKWVEKLDFKTVIEPLIIKPIIHPFKITPPEITEKHIELLKQWASVGASVVASVGAYISSFFNIPKWKYVEHKKGQNPFQSCIDLWEQGLVPSFDGKTWGLHSKDGIVYELKK